MGGRYLVELAQQIVRNGSRKQDPVGRDIMLGEECILPGAAAGWRCAIAHAIAADKDKQRIRVLANDFCCRFKCLRKSAIRLKVPGDKSDDRRITRFQHAPVRQSQRCIAGLGGKPVVSTPS